MDSDNKWQLLLLHQKPRHKLATQKKKHERDNNSIKYIGLPLDHNCTESWPSAFIQNICTETMVTASFLSLSLRQHYEWLPDRELRCYGLQWIHNENGVWNVGWIEKKNVLFWRVASHVPIVHTWLNFEHVLMSRKSSTVIWTCYFTLLTSMWKMTYHVTVFMHLKTSHDRLQTVYFINFNRRAVRYSIHNM